MIILGIDPGLATIGFGLIDKQQHNKFVCLDYGTIQTKPTFSIPERLTQIRTDLEKLLETSKPKQVAVEELFFSKNIKTGIQVAEARGVILEVINSKNIPLFEIKPNEVKSIVAGYGHAEKQQIQTMTKKLLNLPTTPKPDDAADALAIALTCGFLLR